LIKILYITNGINGSGGLERVLSIKTNGLIEQHNYEIHLLTLNEKDVKPFYPFNSKIHFHNINVHGNFISYLFAYYRGIKKVIKDINPDIISVCDDGLKGLLFPLIFGKKIPVIYERHAAKMLNFSSKKGYVNQIKTKIIDILMNLGQRRFDKFIVLTSGNIKDWQYKKNIEVIPNPVSFFPDTFSNLENKKIIAVGSHSYNKGYDLLLESWKQIIEKFSDWKLHIYGKFDDNKTFIKLSEQLNLNETVVFHQPVKNIEEKYLDSSVLVLPSRSEGFGMVLIEAMACGLPCVAFDCPHGPADIIRNNEDGFLVENGNSKEFADKLSLVMNDIALRKKMGRKAKYNVHRFSLDEVLIKWNNIFQNLKK